MTPATDNPSAYQDHVQKMFAEGSPIIFNNKDRAHAAILISTLFKSAKNEIVMLCRTFDADFYSDQTVSEALRSAVKNGVKLRMRIQEETGAKTLLEELKKIGGEKVEIRHEAPNSPGAVAPMNFTVVDGKAFRLERDRNTSAAVACANNPIIASEILDLFNSLG